MPKLTRWYLKIALIYFLAALLTGLILSAPPWFPFSSLPGLSPVYIHLFVVGWLTQLIFGVTYWMFPKFSMENPRGSETLGWVTFILLNIGLILRAIGEPLVIQLPESVWGWILVLSALLQWLAGIGFVLNTWSRVKER